MTDSRPHGDVTQPPIDTPELGEISPEKKEELMVMKRRIENALNDPEIKQQVFGDFSYTFQQLGLSVEQSNELCQSIMTQLLQPQSLDKTERDILNQFGEFKIENKNLIEVLHEKLKGRADLIFSQLKEYLKDVKGKVFDYGAGDGQVTQKLHDELGLDIEGGDVRSYVAKGVSIPVRVFSGKRVEVEDNHYEAAVMTNVAHHERDNEQILQELSRIVAKKLVVIETVPVGQSEEEISKDKERTFMNDYLYNRLFHNADVPVPGTFETPQGWIDRFTKYGWRVKHSVDLGFDQPTIKDVHHLLVLEKSS